MIQADVLASRLYPLVCLVMPKRHYHRTAVLTNTPLAYASDRIQFRGAQEASISDSPLHIDTARAAVVKEYIFRAANTASMLATDNDRLRTSAVTNRFE